ncbi:MAG: hypothetical protein QOF04_2308 [Solirubrobacteraceae bacterium]|nr:hypothetical protein [Solirubrobacteraceae bacterium]
MNGRGAGGEPRAATPHDDPAQDITLRAGVTICVEPILAPQNADRTPAAIPVFEEQVAISADGCEVLSAGPPRTPAHAGVAARPGATGPARPSGARPYHRGR